MSAGCLLIEEDVGWRLVVADAKSNHSEPQVVCEIATAPPDQIAAAIADTLQHRKLRTDVIVAPKSSSVCFARFESEIRDHQSLLFEMEASLPFDAESAVADFVINGDSISGIALETARWRPLISALEEAGIRVQSVVPLAVLAASQLLAEKKFSLGDFVIWSNADRVDLIVPDADGFRIWKHVPQESKRLPLEINAIAAHVGNDSTITIRERDDVESDLTEHQSAAAARAASRILSRKQSPWYELRRDALVVGDSLRAYGGPLRVLLGTAVLALSLVIGMSIMRQFRIEAAIDRVQSEQRTVFKEAFPDARVPAALVSRMKSEHRKALGARQTNNVVPESRSAVDVVDTFLKGLSGSARCRVTRLVVEDGTIRADVQLRNHSDAGRVAASLEKSGFAMLPPGTEQLNPQTVASRLEGRIADVADASDESSTGRGAQ